MSETVISLIGLWFNLINLLSLRLISFLISFCWIVNSKTFSKLIISEFNNSFCCLRLFNLIALSEIERDIFFNFFNEVFWTSLILFSNLEFVSINWSFLPNKSLYSSSVVEKFADIDYN